MRENSLNSIEPRINFQARKQRVDRISMSFTLSDCLSDNSHEVHQLFQQLSRSSDMLRSNGSSTHPCLVFKQKRYPRLLMNGEIRYLNSGRGRPTLRAFIIMNVTEYFNNNPVSRRVPENYYLPLHRLEASPRGLVRSTAITLDQRANCIPVVRASEADRVCWAHLTRQMYSDVADVLRRHLRNLGVGGMFNFSDNYPSAWSIRELEIYQEFDCSAAMTFARTFAHHCSCYLPKRKEKHFAAGDNDTVAAYRFPALKNGISFSVYAKTEDRVRFECEYKNPKTNLHNEFNNRIFPANSNLCFEEGVQYLLNTTPERMQPFSLAKQTLDTTSVMQQIDLLDTMAALATTVGANKVLLKRVLNFIGNQGKLRKGIDGDLDNFIARAEKNGLLRGHRKARGCPKEYTPSPTFKELVDRLDLLNPRLKGW